MGTRWVAVLGLVRLGTVVCSLGSLLLVLLGWWPCVRRAGGRGWACCEVCGVSGLGGSPWPPIDLLPPSPEPELRAGGPGLRMLRFQLGPWAGGTPDAFAMPGERRAEAALYGLRLPPAWAYRDLLGRAVKAVAVVAPFRLWGVRIAVAAAVFQLGALLWLLLRSLGPSSAWGDALLAAHAALAALLGLSVGVLAILWGRGSAWHSSVGDKFDIYDGFIPVESRYPELAVQVRGWIAGGVLALASALGCLLELGVRLHSWKRNARERREAVEAEGAGVTLSPSSVNSAPPAATTPNANYSHAHVS